MAIAEKVQLREVLLRGAKGATRPAVFGVTDSWTTRGKVFGVQFDNSVNTSRCTRIADAVGMETNYAIGSEMKYPGKPNDFDYVFPWCSMRRCNIRKDKSIVYEGEDGFSLVGTTIDPTNIYEDGACTVLEASIAYEGGALAASSACRTVVISCKPNTTYAVSLPTDYYNRFQMVETVEPPAVGVAVQNRTAWTYAESHATTANGRTYCVATTMADTQYLCVYYYISTYDKKDESEIRAMLMVTEGGAIEQFKAYSSMEAGDVFVEIPKFYSFREVLGSIETICITGEKKSGFLCEPAFIDQYGNELEFIYVAAYNTGTDGSSTTGQMPQVQKRIDQFREAAAGKGFSTFDFATLMAIQKLVLIELADRDASAYYNGFGYLPYYQGATALETEEATNTVTVEGNFNVQHFRVGQWIAVSDNKGLADRQITALGELTEDDSTPNRPYRLAITFDGDPVNVAAGTTQVYCTGQPSGLSDEMTYHTGTAGDNGYSACRYRWIENLWGNVWEQCSGVVVKNLEYYMTLNPALYGYESAPDSWEKIGYAAPEQPHYPGEDNLGPSYIKRMGYDKSRRLIALPGELELTPIHYKDKLYTVYRTGGPVGEYDEDTVFICVTGGGWDHLDRNGPFAMRFWSKASTDDAGYSWLYGSRLLIREDLNYYSGLGLPTPTDGVLASIDVVGPI